MRTMFGSRSWQYNLTKMRSVPLVRCLPKDVVVDSHWFTDCHLEAIFNMNTARLQQSASISDHRRQEKCSSDHRRFSLNPAQHDILPHRQSQLSDLTIRLHITTSLKSISQKRWLFHLIFNIGGYRYTFTLSYRTETALRVMWKFLKKLVYGI